VWLGGFEPPTTPALIGGAIILATLAVNSYLTMREVRIEREMAFADATASQKVKLEESEAEEGKMRHAGVAVL
jgi:hypothetical protein